jgi:RNA polymerase subunit RPABC4/transcription elongation factor Spt4
MKICQQCNAEMPDNQKFCGSCGAEIKTPEPERRICGNCNMEIPENMQFCGGCGTAYIKAEPIPQPDPTPVPVAVAQPEPPKVNSTVYTDTYDIFLSYRRNGGETMAILLRDRLVAKGYNVFLDIENLNSGSFNNKLLNVIDNCKDFLLICSENSLDRCNNDGDWVRLEIAYALQKNKNIIPVMLRGFAFPDTLPADIEAIRMQNGVNANSHEYFDAAIDRLAEKFLISKSKGIIPIATQQSTVQPAIQSNTSQEENFKKIFVDPDEQHICTLGNSHLQKYFREKSLEKAFSIISNKSVYFRGKSYDINNKCKKKAVSQAVPLNDITGTSVAKHKIPLFLILGIVSAIIGLIGAVFVAGDMFGYNSRPYGLYVEDFLIMALVVCFLFASVYFLARFSKKEELLTISFNSGTVSYKTKWFPVVESDNYQRELRLTIERTNNPNVKIGV